MAHDVFLSLALACPLLSDLLFDSAKYAFDDLNASTPVSVFSMLPYAAGGSHPNLLFDSAKFAFDDTAYDSVQPCLNVPTPLSVFSMLPFAACGSHPNPKPCLASALRNAPVSVMACDVFVCLALSLLAVGYARTASSGALQDCQVCRSLFAAVLLPPRVVLCEIDKFASDFRLMLLLSPPRVVLYEIVLCEIDKYATDFLLLVPPDMLATEFLLLYLLSPPRVVLYEIFGAVLLPPRVVLYAFDKFATDFLLTLLVLPPRARAVLYVTMLCEIDKYAIVQTETHFQL